MKKISYFLLITGVFMLYSCNQQQRPDYPVTNKTDHVDTYFGQDVEDPYQWLEDDNSEETAAWVKAQNQVTDAYLDGISFKDKIRDRLTELWNYPKYGTPFKAGDYYFFFKNDGIQNQDVIYIQEGIDAEAKIFLDPNTFSEDGTVALASYAISKDASYFAYSIAESGSDWNTIYVVDVPSGNKLNDEIHWVKFSGISWKDDGFFYSRYDAPDEGEELSGKNEYHKVYYHKLGENQDKDVLVFEDKEHPLRNCYAQTTEDESFLILYQSQSSSGNALYSKDLTKDKSEFKLLAEGFDNQYGVVDNLEDQLLVITNNDAARKKLVLINPAKADKKDWKIVIPEKKEVLQSVSLVGGKIIARYMKDASSKAYIYDMNGTYIEELSLPCLGSIGSFRGKKDDNIAFYSFSSFTFPSVIYKYDVLNNKSEIYKESDIDVNIDNYETTQVFYTSKDGTEVPMFIVHRKDIVLDGNNPVLLYGYGGFNVSLTPYFSVSRLLMLENGGVFALPNIRGGGEYGEEWHEGGTKLNKQNVFDDFIAAAEYLIDEGYTNPDKIAISGGSNGGLLVGACMTQRPELFKVALPAVGVMDMLKFHKFTIGWAWTGDYGSSDDSTQFKYLLSYSPYHNLKEGVEYPATLITTADHDDRVVPAHSFKFAARIQECQLGNEPVLIRIETKAGHGAGKPTSKIIDEIVDVTAFTFYNLDIKPIY